MMFDFDPQVSSMPLNPLERRDNTSWWHSWMGNRTTEDTPWVTDGASAFKAPLNSGMEAGFRLMAAENRRYPVRSNEMHHAVDAVLKNGIAPVLFHGVVNLKDGDDEVDYGLFTTQEGIFYFNPDKLYAATLVRKWDRFFLSGSAPIGTLLLFDQDELVGMVMACLVDKHVEKMIRDLFGGYESVPPTPGKYEYPDVPKEVLDYARNFGKS